MKLEEFYSDNKLQGPNREWYENGQQAHEAFFVNGLEDSTFSNWWESGQLYVKGQYDNGKRIGKWVFYEEDGTVRKRKKYETSQD